MSRYVSAGLRRHVRQRAESLCEYCLIHERDTFLGCQIDHIISEKHGGQTVESNLALACVFCNRYKGTDVAALQPGTGKLCRLFNPRIDLWVDHFRIEGIRIKGITEIGDATAALLSLNSADRLLEREALVRAGRYPAEPARRRAGILRGHE